MVDFYALQRISASIPMTQLGGKMQATWRFANKSYLNFQSSFAFTLSGKEQPYYNSRMLGYRSLYMQGLEYYVADGNMAGMIRATLRREILAFTLKNLVRSKSHSVVPFKFFLKTYGNLGYAHSENPGNNFMNNQLLRTAGFGVDIMMIYDMVLKLEYSYNQFGERGFFIHTATDF
jgi:opacity protein-like surface antigen